MTEMLVTYLGNVENALCKAAREYSYVSWWQRLWQSEKWLDARMELEHQCRRMSQCLEHMKIEQDEYSRLCEKLRQIESTLIPSAK